MEMFEVGGVVRDSILGRKAKDVDFVVVLDPEEITPRRTRSGKMVERTPFEVMEDLLMYRGFRIFQSNPKFLTTRAQFPTYSGHPALIGRERKGLTADFVLARKESDYTDGRRPDVVEVGTLYDDLARRDFTMNAMARTVDGSLIDPHNGAADLSRNIIRAVGDPLERLREDALRALRALRFSVVLNMTIDTDLRAAMRNSAVLEMLTKVKDERKREELEKMFFFSTLDSLEALSHYPGLTEVVFSGSVGLEPSMKMKRRNK